MTFLPADCKDRFVTTEHLLKVGKRGEEREVKIEIRLPALLPSSINVDISEFYIMSECGFENVPLTLWFWSRAVENRFQCVSCFFGCLAFPDQTWIDHDILYKCQACACAHVHTQIQKWIKVSKIKKIQLALSSGLFRIFPSRVYPLSKTMHLVLQSACL